MTSSCQTMLFAGFNTQWFSSGKYKSSDGMPRRCNAVKAVQPSVSHAVCPRTISASRTSQTLHIHNTVVFSTVDEQRGCLPAVHELVR